MSHNSPLFSFASRPLSRRSILRGGLAVGVAGLTAACSNPDSVSRSGASGGGSAKSLVVYDGGGAWGEAQRTAFFQPFQEETGIEVIPAPAGGDQPRLRAAILAGAPGMDVVSVSGGNIGAWEDEGLLLKIDFAKWATPGLREEFAPFPTSDFRVPSIIFAVQMAWNEAVTGAPLTSWSDFWNVSSFPGPRSVKAADSSSGATFEIALLADGVAPGDLYPLDFERALNKLAEIRDSVPKFWESGAESVQLLIDEQVAAVAAWNGRIDTAISDGAEGISTSWDQAILQVDYWAIPKGAANVEAAQRFIEFAVQPDRQAAFAKLITYAPTLPQAYDLIPEERQAKLATAPAVKDRVVTVDTDFWASKNADGMLMPEVANKMWQEWLTK